MSTTRSGLPAGRYGRGDAESTTRRLRLLGAVLAVACVVAVAWAGYAYLHKQQVTGQVLGYKVVSDESVQIHIEVRKPKDTDGVCTVRSRSADGAEVGVKDVPIKQHSEDVSTVIQLQTTARATDAELVSCQSTH
jgi:Domain of unknown function (DUF4307)